MDLKPHLEALRQRLDRLEADMSRPDAAAHPADFQKRRREHSRLAPVIREYGVYQALLKERVDLKHLAESQDSAMKQMALEELPGVEQRIKDLEAQLRLALLPQDPNTDRDILLEIRAGAGGDEAGLFAAELLRMYSRYSELQ